MKNKIALAIVFITLTTTMFVFFQNFSTVESTAVLPGNFLTDEYKIFTRRVEQLTGRPGNLAGIAGQDTPIIFEWGDRVYFLFGDTVFNNPNRFFDPNSMGYTTDKDASDGLTLTYYKNNNHLPALNRMTGEFSVWFTGAYLLDGKVYGQYQRVISAANPKENKDLILGNTGIAVMSDPNGNFEYLGVETPNDPHLQARGSGNLGPDGYIYSYIRNTAPLVSNIHVVRVKQENHLNYAEYEYLTPNGWTKDTSVPRTDVIINSNQPHVFWNDYVGQYLGVSSRIFSLGFVSGIQLITSDDLAGPFSKTQLMIDQSANWTDPQSQTYQAKYHSAFNKSNGRIIYSFATRKTTYNVHSYESHLDYVISKFAVAAPADDQVFDLKPSGKSELGLRLLGYSYTGGIKALKTKIRIPLKVANPTTRDIQVRISVGKPNDAAFFLGGTEAQKKADVAGRVRLGAVTVNVSVPAGSTEIVVSDSSDLDNLLTSTFSAPTWNKFGEPNYQSIFVSRVDNVTWSPTIGQIESGQIARMEYCHGSCSTKKIACLGDSNTSVGWTGQNGRTPVKGWCELINDKRVEIPWKTYNHAVVAQSLMSNGQAQLNQALSSNPDLDAVILAFGTNDKATSPDLIVQEYARLKAQIEALGKKAFITLTPPRICPVFDPNPNAHGQLTNQLLRERFAPRDLIDFYTGFEPSTYFLDCLHFNQAAQTKRGSRAFQTLRLNL